MSLINFTTIYTSPLYKSVINSHQNSNINYTIDYIFTLFYVTIVQYRKNYEPKTSKLWFYID